MITMLLITLLSVSCNRETKRNQQLKKMLIGEWELCREKSKFAEEEKDLFFFYKPFGIEFSQDSIEFFNGFFQTEQDSLTGKRMLSYYGNFVPYYIKRDSIFMQNAFNHNIEFKWKFICLSHDTLILAPDDMTTLKFKRLKYDKCIVADFDQIVYSSSGCYGYCPIIDISINNNGHMLFQGEGYVKKLGFYEGQLDNNLRKRVFDKFHKANPLRLQKQYSASHTDDESITTTYIKNNKIIKTIHDYGKKGTSELIWAYISIANLHDVVNLNRIPDDEPFYPKYHYYTFEKGRLILPLEKSESFYLWTELKKSKITSQKFTPNYTITFTGNYTYWGPDANEREHKFEYKKITSDGRFFKFEYKNAPSETYDLGYNFIERNFEKGDFIELKKSEKWMY